MDGFLNSEFDGMKKQKIDTNLVNFVVVCVLSAMRRKKYIIADNENEETTTVVVACLCL